jgi:uncharacterized integral membrane protein
MSTPPDAETTPGTATAAAADQSERNKVFPSSESIRAVGALIAVVIGVLAVTALAIATMAFIDSGKDANSEIPLATAAFGVISAVVGAFLGIKIGTDQSKTFADAASQAREQLAAVKAVVPANLKDEVNRAAGEASSRPEHT